MITIDYPGDTELSKSGLTRFFNRAREAVGIEGSIDVLLTDDATLRSLNKTFRGKNKATDVLSEMAKWVSSGWVPAKTEYPASIALFTTGVRELPLSSAYTLFFIAPLLITMLSVPVLKERVPASHWWAIAFGFVGVLIALRPSGSDLQAGFATLGGLGRLGRSGLRTHPTPTNGGNRG